jgi:hypothetical protein
MESCLEGVESMTESYSREQCLPVATPLPDMGLLIESGQQERKEIRRFKHGGGTLAWQVEAILESWREGIGLGADVEVVPVVVLYRQAEPDYVVVTVKG